MTKFKDSITITLLILSLILLLLLHTRINDIPTYSNIRNCIKEKIEIDMEFCIKEATKNTDFQEKKATTFFIKKKCKKIAKQYNCG